MRGKRNPPAVTYHDLAAVDQALQTIAAAESDAAALATALKARLASVTADCDGRIQSLLATAKETRELVEGFCDQHPELFEKPRHQELPHGKIGYRLAESIKLLVSPESVVAALESRGWPDAVIVKKTPDKEALARFPDQILADVGAKRVVKDHFYIEIAGKVPAPATATA
jgi:phage host-nuclease inhibitor protein Gam